MLNCGLNGIITLSKMITLEYFITFLHSCPPEIVSLLEIIVCFIAMAMLLRFYQVEGLYVFITVLLIAGNIQVLKGAQFSFLPHPIALGTTLFGIIAVTFDIITEYYGKKAALKGVRLSFFMLIFFSILMLLTVGLKPLSPSQLKADELFLVANHEHIKALFLPLPAILIASLTAYLTSQYADVMVFNLLRQISNHHLLWLRTVVSTAISALIDTCLFSFLAWRFLNPQPVSWETLLFVYILGSYPLRLACSFCFSPLVYLARYWLPKKEYDKLS